MKKLSLATATGIALTATTSAMLAFTTTPAHAYNGPKTRPIDYVGKVGIGQTATIPFAVLPADLDLPNDPDYEKLGKSYLSLGIQNLGTQVSFTLNNLVPTSAPSTILHAAIESLYIHDTGNLLGSFQGFNFSGPNVNFKVGANPNNIPNALNSYPSEFVTKWSAQAAKPSSTAPGSRTTYAVRSGQSLTTTFALNQGNTFDTLLRSLDRGDSRVGINVIGLGANRNLSATYQNVPEPITVLGSGVALGFGALLKRKASKAKKLIKKVATV